MKILLKEFVKKEKLTQKEFGQKYNVPTYSISNGIANGYKIEVENKESIIVYTNMHKCYRWKTTGKMEVFFIKSPTDRKNEYQRKYYKEYRKKRVSKQKQIKIDKYNNMAHNLPLTNIIHDWMQER